MPISAMHLIKNQDSTVKHIISKEWLTTSESITFIKNNCELLWWRDFNHLYNSRRKSYSEQSVKRKLYKLAYDGRYGIESDSFYDNGGRLSRFYSKQSLKRANEVLQYRDNTMDFWEADNVLKDKKNELKEARENLQYYANLVVELEAELKNGTLQRKLEKARLEGIEKDKNTLTFDVQELHELSKLI